MTATIACDEFVLGGGWLVAHYPRVQCAYFGPNVDDASFDRYLEQLERDIVERSSTGIGILYFAEDADMDSGRRRRMAKVLEQHKQKLTQSTAAYALATRSPFVRGILTTLFWLAPPGYPYKVVSTPLQGLEFIAERVPGIDAQALARSFEQLLATQLERRAS